MKFCHALSRQPVGSILLAAKTPCPLTRCRLRNSELPELIQQTGETLHVGDGTRQETVRHGQPALLSVHHGEIDLRQLLTVAVVPPNGLVQFRVGGDRRDVVAESRSRASPHSLKNVCRPSSSILSSSSLIR